MSRLSLALSTQCAMRLVPLHPCSELPCKPCASVERPVRVPRARSAAATRDLQHTGSWKTIVLVVLVMVVLIMQCAVMPCTLVALDNC